MARAYRSQGGFWRRWHSSYGMKDEGLGLKGEREKRKESTRGRTFWEEATQEQRPRVLPQRPVWPGRWYEARACQAMQGNVNCHIVNFQLG